MRTPGPAAPLVAAIVLGGCWTEDGLGPDDPFACTDMGCSDRLEIDLARRDGEPFSPGSYAFTFTPDGEDPFLVSCALEGGGALGCAGDTGVFELTVDGAGTVIAAVALMAPTRLLVRVEREGLLLGEEDLAPGYSMVTPNGPDCDPVCFQAAVSVELSAPPSR